MAEFHMDVSQTHILPTKEEIALFPLFRNLQKENIHVINTLQQCKEIELTLSQEILLGFDTESKPTFQAGEKSTGPHLIQLSSFTQAFLFQVNDETLNFLKSILNNHQQIKVGFGLKNDAHLFRKMGIELNGIVELSKCFSAFALKNSVGIKNAMALLFQVNFPKSKKISTSNWSKNTLSPQQIAYAAADAYGAILIFEELKRLAVLPEQYLK